MQTAIKPLVKRNNPQGLSLVGSGSEPTSDLFLIAVTNLGATNLGIANRRPGQLDEKAKSLSLNHQLIEIQIHHITDAFLGHQNIVDLLQRLLTQQLLALLIIQVFLHLTAEQ